MTDSAHNIQRELKDVNNLWYWPKDGYSGSSIGPTHIFKPDFMKWMTASDTGYLVSPQSNSCTFTSNSVSGRRDGTGYQAAVFLDLKSGNYVISFDADNTGQMYFVKYVYQDETNVKFGNSKTTATFEAGHSDIQFEIPAGCCAMMQFHGLPERDWVTVTNIVIKEGVL